MSDTSSGSDGGLAIWGATALCILYFLVFLRTCYVLVPYLYSWYKRRYGGEASDRSILNADDFQQYGTRSADSRSESDKKSVPILLIRFFEICALFSLTRAVLWGIAINEDWLVHRWARYILLPTAAFLTMLLLIGVSWWRIYVRFVTATQQTHTFWCVSMEVMKRVMDIFPRVLIGCCLVISIGLFIANVDGDDNWEAEVMVLTSSVSFLLVGLLFLFVGYGIRKQLSQLPYNYPGAAELQRRVMRVSLVVGPTCIVRAVIILFQLSAWFGDDDGFIDFIQGRGESGRYFPLMFYVVFEICPILIIFMTVQLNSANEKDEDDEAPPQQVRNQSIAAYSHETRSIETMFSSNRPTQATRAKGSSISPLGLNVSQRQVVMTGDPQQAKAAVVPLKDALKISSATPPAKSSKPLPAAAADLDGFPGFLPPPDSASPPTVDDSACDSNRPETLGPFSSSLNADEADHHPSRE